MTYPAVFIYDDLAFRTALPPFADIVNYPPAVMQQFFTNASSYIDVNNYRTMVDGNRQLALNLMTAHLATLTDLLIADDGNLPGIVTSAAIDKIRVTLEKPPAKSQWAWWLSLTPYGQQLYALLQAQAVGGWSVGGMPERAAFRRVAGIFGGRFA